VARAEAAFNTATASLEERDDEGVAAGVSPPLPDGGATAAGWAPLAIVLI